MRRRRYIDHVNKSLLFLLRKKDVQAHPEGGPGLNYTGVANQTAGWPLASMSFVLVDWELYITAVFVHRISMID